MKESMKHRLVGAAVLIGLGVIAWPVVFDTTPVREISQRSQIPDPPPEQPFIIAEPERVELPPESDSAALREQLPEEPIADLAPSPEPGGAQTPAKPVAKNAVPDPLPRTPVPPVRTDGAGLPEQWALQLGVFSDRGNAMELRSRAEKAGYHALVQTVGSGQARKYRVYAEPKLDRAAVQRAAVSVEQKLGIKGYVTRYYP